MTAMFSDPVFPDDVGSKRGQSERGESVKVELYRAIREENIGFLRANEASVDEVLAGPSPDARRGVSLIIPVRIDPAVYAALLEEFTAIEPDQYYYPRDDLHTTVFDFLSAREGYVPDRGREEAFRLIAEEVCRRREAFSLRFRGVVFSREAGLLKGYDDEALIDLRERIRTALLEAGLGNDERYRSRSAHCTFMRFRAGLRCPGRFETVVNAWSERDLGNMPVTSAELVEHDWYNRKASKRIIGVVTIPEAPIRG